jgi:hypothetical protein
MGTGKSRLQKSEPKLHLKLAKILGYIAPTKNHTTLAITTLKYALFQN